MHLPESATVLTLQPVMYGFGGFTPDTICQLIIVVSEF